MRFGHNNKDKRVSTAIQSRMAVFAVMILGAVSCGKLGDTINTARENIIAALQTQGIYERNNLPDDPRPNPDQIKGYFDIVNGAYRHILSEGLPGEENINRGSAAEYGIERGDSIAFYFDAKIFTRGNFESQQTFYTNIEARIAGLVGNNTEFNGWSTKPLRIKVGEDPSILKSLQEALISCRAGDGNPDNDDEEGGIASDQVRVYLTPDIAFGDNIVYNVPRASTVVFEVTEIVIIK
jgi:hypothetical protein